MMWAGVSLFATMLVLSGSFSYMSLHEKLTAKKAIRSCDVAYLARYLQSKSEQAIFKNKKLLFDIIKHCHNNRNFKAMIFQATKHGADVNARLTSFEKGKKVYDLGLLHYAMLSTENKKVIRDIIDLGDSTNTCYISEKAKMHIFKNKKDESDI